MHWWDQHVEDLESSDLEEICHQVLDLYAQPVTATKDALVSPPPGAAPKVGLFLFTNKYCKTSNKTQPPIITEFLEITSFCVFYYTKF